MKIKKRILIVDDEKDYCYFIKANLSLTGKYKVMVADAGGIGMLLARCHWHKPDLILLDMNMPGLNGLEVLKKLKRGQMTSKIPIVILTGTNNLQIKTKAEELKCDGYLLKPVGSDELITVIDNLLKDTISED